MSSGLQERVRSHFKRPGMSAVLSAPVPIDMPNAFSKLRIAFGAFFLLVGGLKLLGWSVDPYARIGPFTSPTLQLVVVLFELLLGTWLLLGRWHAGAWLVTIGAFCLFAGFSVYSGWIGEASCGCFGTVKVSPWWTFGFDVAAISLMVWKRPENTLRSILKDPAGTRAMRNALSGALGVSVLLSISLALAYGIFGSPAAALAYMRGEKATLSPLHLDIGAEKQGTFKPTTITITNWTEKPMRVVGGSRDCTISAASKLPLIIPPRQSIQVPILVHFPKAHGYFTRTGMLLLEEDGLRQAFFQFAGRSLGDPSTQPPGS